MKKFYLSLLSLSAITICSAQTDMSFEPGGYGANYTWNVFENSDDPPLLFSANPNPTGINTSATVAEFTVRAAGNPWAGTETQHGSTGMATWTITPENTILKISVYKKVISDVGIKLVMPSHDARPEKKVPNTVINQWEELTFDFTDLVNHPLMPQGAAANIYDQIVIFPDYGPRESDLPLYFDNIIFGDNDIEDETGSTKDHSALVINLFPNPVKDVLSLNCRGTIENLEVYNMLGQQVLSAKPGTGIAQFNVSNLQGGIYTVNALIGDIYVSQKFIKE